MNPSDSENLNQRVQKIFSGTPDKPAHEGIIGFSRKIIPFTGINSFPHDIASSIEFNDLGNRNIGARPDENTLNGRAELRLYSEAQRQQKNIEDISSNAVPFINKDAKPDEVEDDWLSSFYDKIRLVSDKEVQKLWSHILASEFNNPGSFSPLTLRTLSVLTKKDAQLFRKLCSSVWTDNDNDSFVAISDSEIDDYSLLGLRPVDIYHLQDIGLIDYHSFDRPYSSEYLELFYHGASYTVSAKGTTENTVIKDFPVGPVTLTLSGRELFSICTPEPNWDYMKKMIAVWNDKGFELIERAQTKD